jgi:hypothetical protein
MAASVTAKKIPADIPNAVAAISQCRFNAVLMLDMSPLNAMTL